MKQARFPETPRKLHFANRWEWFIESKACEISRNMARVALSSNWLILMEFSSLETPSKLESPDLKPLCFGSRILLSPRKSLSRRFTILSIVLQREFVRAIGLYEDEEVAILFGLRIGTIEDFFH